MLLIDQVLAVVSSVIPDKFIFVERIKGFVSKLFAKFCTNNVTIVNIFKNSGTKEFLSRIKRKNWNEYTCKEGSHSPLSISIYYCWTYARGNYN